MPFRGIALEYVVRAAIRTSDFPGFEDIQKNTRVQVPGGGAGRRALQRQVVGRDLDGRMSGGGHEQVLCQKRTEEREEERRCVSPLIGINAWKPIP